MQIKDAVKFILRHRRGTDAFKGLSMAQLATMLGARFENGTAAAIVENGQLTGIVLAAVDSAQTVHVEHILCTTKSAFVEFRKLVRRVYPGLPLTANHRGRPRVYRRI